jgi:hypothetical protein
MNDEFENLNKSSHGLVKVLSWHFPAGILENYKNTTIRIADVPAEI